MTNGCVSIPERDGRKTFSLSRAKLHNFCDTRWKLHRLNVGGKTKIQLCMCNKNNKKINLVNSMSLFQEFK